MISWYVVVRVDIDDEKCDPAEIVADMDYNMTHIHIHDTEIVDVLTEGYL